VGRHGAARGALSDSAQHAHERFYAALGQNLAGDTAAMADIWSESEDITNMGPLEGILVGRDAVLDHGMGQSHCTRPVAACDGRFAPGPSRND
jgi:hypothetical protein